VKALVHKYSKAYFYKSSIIYPNKMCMGEPHMDNWEYTVLSLSGVVCRL
jgi:hypothetical protein